MQLSIIIITKNEEINIKRTLNAIVDGLSGLRYEIIVIDSGSNDNTENIVRNYTNQFYYNNWTGYSDQRNFGNQFANGEWILFLDADEVITKELASEIIQICISNNKNVVYNLKRKTHYLGKLLNYAWYPDVKSRLVHKDLKPTWDNKQVHESLLLQTQNANTTYKNTNNFLIHYSYHSISHHFEKTLYYSLLSARENHKKGKKFSYFNLLLNPIIAFVRLYIIRLGFLDGFPGLVSGFSTYYYTFMKYLYLKELEDNNI